VGAQCDGASRARGRPAARAVHWRSRAGAHLPPLRFRVRNSLLVCPGLVQPQRELRRPAPLLCSVCSAAGDSVATERISRRGVIAVMLIAFVAGWRPFRCIRLQLQLFPKLVLLMAGACLCSADAWWHCARRERQHWWVAIINAVLSLP
jgi:hypothetical protein